MCGAPADWIFRRGAAASVRMLQRRDASGILNLCRYAAFAVEGKVLSESEDGFWGLTHLSEKWRDFIRYALDIESCIGDIAWNFDGCETFR